MKCLPKRGSHTGFTLIELLIVIAILAIMSAATFAVFTAPLQEEVHSAAEASAEAGLGSFFSSLVRDAHNAAAVEATPGHPGFALPGAAPEGGKVVYWVDPEQRLRRAVLSAEAAPELSEKQGAALVENVNSLTVEPVEGTTLWRIQIRGGTTRLGRASSYDRAMEVAVGLTSAGGGAK